MTKMGWADGVVLLLKLRAVLVLVALLILFSALTPSFLTANNLSILAKHVAISALLAVGITFVRYCELDARKNKNGRYEYLSRPGEAGVGRIPRDTVTFAYQHGGASLMDFLNAQSDYRVVQLAYLQLIGAYMTAAGQMNLAVGREVIQ